MTDTHLTSELSIEAKVLLGSLYKIMAPNELRFQRPRIIHPKARKGLNDLVNSGYLTVETYSHNGAMCWTKTDKMKDRPKISTKFVEDNIFPITTE